MKCTCMRQLWTFICMHEFFPHLSIVSVDGKQYLGDVVFSALVRFSLYTSTHHRAKQSITKEYYMSSIGYMMLCGARDRSSGQQVIGASITAIVQHIPHTWFRLFLAKTRLLWFTRRLTLLIWLSVTSGCSHQKFGYFSNNENLTRALKTTSLKCCLPSTAAINWWEKIHACEWRFKVASCKHASLRSTKILQKRHKVGYFSNGFCIRGPKYGNIQQLRYISLLKLI